MPAFIGLVIFFFVLTEGQWGSDDTWTPYYSQLENVDKRSFEVAPLKDYTIDRHNKAVIVKDQSTSRFHSLENCLIADRKNWKCTQKLPRSNDNFIHAMENGKLEIYVGNQKMTHRHEFIYEYYVNKFFQHLNRK